MWSAKTVRLLLTVSTLVLLILIGGTAESTLVTEVNAHAAPTTGAGKSLIEHIVSFVNLLLSSIFIITVGYFLLVFGFYHLHPEGKERASSALRLSVIYVVAIGVTYLLANGILSLVADANTFTLGTVFLY